MRDFRLPPVYPITSKEISGLSHREQAERLLAGGAGIIQLRDKGASPRALYAAAKGTLEVTRKHAVSLIINDRVDIALALGADGVHLGQDDLLPVKAREILGDNAIIGYSTHSVEQAIMAAAMPIDYIAIGPVFSTRTKAHPDPVVGLDGLSAVRRAVGKTPLVGIGGITASNVNQVLNAGADCAAVISAILAGPGTIEDEMGAFLAALR